MIAIRGSINDSVLDFVASLRVMVWFSKMIDGLRSMPVNEDQESLLAESEKDSETRQVHDHSSATILLVVITACVALMAGVLLERYLFLDTDSVCAAHVSQSSE